MKIYKLCLVLGLFALTSCGIEPLNPRANQDMKHDITTVDMPSDTPSDFQINEDMPTVADMSEMTTTVDMVREMSIPAYKSAGCQTGQGLSEGEQTFMLDGKPRRFIVRLPKNYDQNRAWPMLLALHGNGQSVDFWDKGTNTRNIRDVVADDAILIVVEAIDKLWRDYDDKPGWSARIEKELAYFEHVISQTKNELCVDTEAIFSIGFSGGGSFSGLLGCRRADIRAFAAGGSVIYFDETKCINTPAAWITIGKDELSGREPFRDFFRDRSSCQSTTKSTQPTPCVEYDDCTAQSPVHYCEHDGAHVWPDFGAQAAWDFLKQFTRGG